MVHVVNLSKRLSATEEMKGKNNHYRAVKISILKLRNVFYVRGAIHIFHIYKYIFTYDKACTDIISFNPRLWPSHYRHRWWERKRKLASSLQTGIPEPTCTCIRLQEHRNALTAAWIPSVHCFHGSHKLVAGSPACRKPGGGAEQGGCVVRRGGRQPHKGCRDSRSRKTGLTTKKAEWSGPVSVGKSPIPFMSSALRGVLCPCVPGQHDSRGSSQIC